MVRAMAAEKGWAVHGRLRRLSSKNSMFPYDKQWADDANSLYILTPSRELVIITEDGSLL